MIMLIPNKLYIVEASESNKKAIAELSIEDPLDEGEALERIVANTTEVKNANSTGNDRATGNRRD